MYVCCMYPGGQMVPVHDGKETIQTFARVEGSPEHTETALLIPDFLMTSYSYQNVIADLSVQHRVVTFDFPGSGHTAAQRKSPASSNDYLVEFIASLTETLQLRAVHVISHGASSRIALDFALKYPKRVRSLTFVAVEPSGLVY